jgi:hypothetical protein
LQLAAGVSRLGESKPDGDVDAASPQFAVNRAEFGDLAGADRHGDRLGGLDRIAVLSELAASELLCSVDQSREKMPAA